MQFDRWAANMDGTLQFTPTCSAARATRWLRRISARREGGRTGSATRPNGRVQSVASRDGGTPGRSAGAKSARGSRAAGTGDRARRANGQRTVEGAGRAIRPRAAKRAGEFGVSADGRGAGEFRKAD